MSLTMGVFFAGAGGDYQGSTAVPGVSGVFAANHWQRAVDSHAANYPDAEHFCGDIKALDLTCLPAWDLFWASPECTEWTGAKGVRREFDKQPDLFGETLPPEAAERSRALMWDVPRYLEAMALRGRKVKAGVVENVVEAREGAQWGQWVAAIQNLGYRTRLIAVNSMHARPVRTQYAPQSRDRLYFAYWLAGIRDPDWDKWLRPLAFCPSCGQWVSALQVWKKPGRDMGKYRQQYVYRCPKVTCRGLAVEPPVVPAAAVINWSALGQRIGDRDKPLAPKTIARIEAGLRRYAIPITLEAAGNTFERRPGVRTWPVTQPITTQTASETKALACPPMLVPAGGTWRDDAAPVTEPMGARTARENDGLAVPPFLAILRGQSVTQRVTDPLGTASAGGIHHGLVSPPMTIPLPFLVPVEGREGKQPVPVTSPHRAQTARAETGLAVPPAMIMRNNGSSSDPGYLCTPVSEPVRSLTTAGHQSLLTWQHLAHLLVPYYGTGVAQPAAEPHRTLPATDRFGLASPAVDVEDVMFRMLEPGEIGAAMAFFPDYIVLGSKRERVRQYGNAVTPPVAEVIVSALVEAIGGESLPHAEDLQAAGAA